MAALAVVCARNYPVKEGDICDTISAVNQSFHISAVLSITRSKSHLCPTSYQFAAAGSGYVDFACSNLASDEICLAMATLVKTVLPITVYIFNGDGICDGISVVDTTILSLDNEDCDNFHISKRSVFQHRFSPGVFVIVPTVNMEAHFLLTDSLLSRDRSYVLPKLSRVSAAGVASVKMGEVSGLHSLYVSPTASPLLYNV